MVIPIAKTIVSLFMVSLLLHPGNSVANQDLSKYLETVREAKDLPPIVFYDYIIVGGGTAGCALASTLSMNYTVLVLERGGVPEETPSVFWARNYWTNIINTDEKNSPGQKFISKEGVVNVRARILGGGTMINGGFYSRADDGFMEKMGLGLDMNLVQESYKWVEETIVYKPNVTPWQNDVKEALIEVGNVPDNGYTLKHIEGTKIGGSIFDGVGRRHGAIELLNRANFTNLRAAVHAKVERVIFSPKLSNLSAIGVTFRDSTGRSHRAMLKGKGEVILSAGALGSPQLLLLSGVGPKQYLSSLKIPVIKDHPFVGSNLVDPPKININFVPPFEVASTALIVVGITKDGYYIESFSGNFPFNSPLSEVLFPYPSPPVNFTVLTIFEKLSDPESVGSLRLASATDVTVTPKVEFNYFSEPEDLASCYRGLRNIGKMVKSNTMAKYANIDPQGNRTFKYVGVSLPENLSDDAILEPICRNSVTTVWHTFGGCLVDKVVDKHFKVIGINSLRVLDGSTFKSSPGTNPQSTLMMLGRYFGIKIRKERGNSSLHGSTGLPRFKSD